MLKYLFTTGFFLLLLTGLLRCSERTNDSEGPSPALSADDELKTFQLEPGLKIQLVASEPMVQEPVVITFDPDGRLWVVEMRGFMPDIDGNGEQDPVGRVSILEDHNGDGEMDSSWVYLDSLVMPRALALVPGGALVVENQALWLTQDLDKDLIADTKTLIDPDYAGNAMPEHSGNGLWRGLDNWYYNAKSRFRYKLVNDEWIRDSTEFRGQWGISHDDKGRLYYNYNWSQLHADLVPPNQLGRNKHHIPTTGIDHGLTLDRRVYPIRPNPAVNRGYIQGTLDAEGRLLEFTAACSPLVYRGHLMSGYRGNVFVCEPSGNLIKRNVVEEDGLLLVASDPNPGTEFLASTDERFRPVFLAAGPDGALYVADMYRGLIQHGAYVTPYLREQTVNRKLVQPIHCGRIWRVVPEDKVPSTRAEEISRYPTSDLIKLLSHDDGWHRDIAQRLLVEKKDRAAAPELTELAVKGHNSVARVHALWTLEGLNLLDAEILISLASDDDPLIQQTALRLIEPFALDDREVLSELKTILTKNVSSEDEQVILQSALTANVLNVDTSVEVLKKIALRHGHSAIIRDAVMSSLEDSEFMFLGELLAAPEWSESDPSREILIEMVTASIIRKNDPREMNSLLALLDPSEDYRWQERAVLTALCVQGSNSHTKAVPLPVAPALLQSNHEQIDSLQRSILLSMFAWPGHTPEEAVESAHVKLSERDLELFTIGRQHYLTACAGCHGMDGAGIARFAPPLVNSEWILGDEKRLALLVLHGIEGPIEVNGKKYDVPDILTVMPAHSTLDDRVITAILTYVRNAWGNQGGPLRRGLVGTTRHTSQGRVMPWTAAELNDHIKATNESDGKLAKD